MTHFPLPFPPLSYTIGNRFFNNKSVSCILTKASMMYAARFHTCADALQEVWDLAEPFSKPAHTYGMKPLCTQRKQKVNGIMLGGTSWNSMHAQTLAETWGISAHVWDVKLRWWYASTAIEKNTGLKGGQQWTGWTRKYVFYIYI